MYRHLNVTGDIDLIDLDQFRLKRDAKRGAMVFKFYNGDWWASLTKQAGQFFAPKTLRDLVWWGKRNEKFFRHRNTSCTRKIF